MQWVLVHMAKQIQIREEACGKERVKSNLRSNVKENKKEINSIFKFTHLHDGTYSM